MKRKVWIIVFCMLTACTTPVTTYHNACMQGHARFADQVGCIRANVAMDASKQNDTLVQEYVMTGDMLVKQVHEGKISEDEARLQFVNKLNDIRRRELDMLADEARISRYHAPLWPRFTDC